MFIFEVAQTLQVTRMNLLPIDDAQRVQLHNEVHARPSARIRLPAFILLVGVFNEGITREQECAHLQRLQPNLTLQDVQGNFVRMRLGDCTVKWERHTEFTRWTVIAPDDGREAFADNAIAVLPAGKVFW